MPLLEAQQLTKVYRSGDRTLPVLAGVDLVVQAGESVSICGASGCGKTTLLHLLAGLDQPDCGTVAWAGTPVGQSGPTGPAVLRRSFLGMIFQSYHLVPEMDVLENLLLAARIAGANGQRTRARALELLGQIGLTDRMHHLPRQLSGGESQRVATARALMNSPRLVLADEPTGNLDEKAGAGVIDLILSLGAQYGAAVVLVTHNVLHAAKTARQLTLTQGLLRG